MDRLIILLFPYIASTRRDYENLTKEMGKIQSENDSAKDEVKDVLQALEELAVNYDQKSQEAETKSREYNTVTEELSQKQSQLNSIQSELQSIKESATHQRKRINEMLRSLLTDLGNFQFHEKKICHFCYNFSIFFR